MNQHNTPTPNREKRPASPVPSDQAGLGLIFDILKRQISISTNFLSLLEAEKKALIEMNMSALISLTRLKERELAKMAQLDHSLQEVARKMVANESSLEGRVIKLIELVPFMPREQALTMKKYRDQLAQLREKISNNNLINKRFASDTLGYINDAISLICKEISSEPIYSMRGRHHATSNAPALLSREV